MWFISEATSGDKDALSECEPPHNKTNNTAFVPSEDTDPPSLIRVFVVRSIGSLGPTISSSEQRRLWSDCADAQVDRCLRWAQWPFCWFCHAVAHVYLAAESLASRESLTADPGVAGSTPARPGHISSVETGHAHFFSDRKRQLSDV